MFIVSSTKNGGLRWARYIGTPFYNEYPHSLAVNPNGNLYFLGTLSSVDYAYGQDDLLIVGVSLTGTTLFVQNVGGDLKESPGGVVYNPDSERIQIFFNT
mmetsp:Transcript_16702/g.16001  ORF Transcript_16702/g.16001 Transcript_16702/m.16001 type:complete len:100 (-) Transcript_16702:462-761(-)